MSCAGYGIGIIKEFSRIALVPFSFPGETVKARPYTNMGHSDLVETLNKSEMNNSNLVKCKYFGKCSGCQFQMLEYSKQLQHKKRSIEKAYRYFSGLEIQPTVEDTLASPEIYAYRTKITPHFDVPKGGYSKGDHVKIGFIEKERRRIIDIEECPIATQVLNKTLPDVRLKVLNQIETYKRGATLLLRQSINNKGDYECVTDYKSMILESVDNVEYKFPAGDFFQNNSIILSKLLNLVQSLIRKVEKYAKPKFLIDAYCGSGLFSIYLAKNFIETIGIEVSIEAIKAATANAQLNKILNSSFIYGTAEKIFEHVKFPHNETVVLIDPPILNLIQLLLYM